MPDVDICVGDPVHVDENVFKLWLRGLTGSPKNWSCLVLFLVQVQPLIGLLCGFVSGRGSSSVGFVRSGA